MLRANRMMKTFAIFFIFFHFSVLLAQESFHKPVFLDMCQLDKLKDQFNKHNSESKKIKKQIESLTVEFLKMKPLSVMEKSVVPPGGDKHDFMSLGPYWWPDPGKADGLPYIRRDGERNPEYHKITDESYLTRTMEAVENLAIAFYVTGDQKFSIKASELLRVWFLNDDTKMNPNMNHAQFIPGVNTGRGIGLIETRSLFKITEALMLLRGSGEWKIEDDIKIKKWFEDYFTWITTHQYGIDESNEKNNHGTWYDVQLTAIAIYLGKLDYAKRILEEVKHKRIDSQIKSGGEQPLELARTKSWGYSLMNLDGFMHLALLGDYTGIDLWNYKSPSGGSIKKALDFLLPYAVDHKKWGYTQISEMENKSLLPLLRVAKKKYDGKLYGAWIKKIFSNEIPKVRIGQLL